MLKADEVLKQADTSVNLDTHYVIAELQNSQGSEYGWNIAMHQDAQVEFKYLYLPNICTKNVMAIEQADAPEPLVFTASGWFGDTISADKLMPIRPPKL